MKKEITKGPKIEDYFGKHGQTERSRDREQELTDQVRSASKVIRCSGENLQTFKFNVNMLPRKKMD